MCSLFSVHSFPAAYRYIVITYNFIGCLCLHWILLLSWVKFSLHFYILSLPLSTLSFHISRFYLDYYAYCTCWHIHCAYWKVWALDSFYYSLRANFFFASEFVYTILLYVAISYYYVSILWLPLNDGFKLWFFSVWLVKQLIRHRCQSSNKFYRSNCKQASFFF